MPPLTKIFSYSLQQTINGLPWQLSGNKSTCLVAQLVKNLPAIQETCVPFLGWEDPPGKEMATHSHMLAWRIPWTEEPSRLQSLGSQRVRQTEWLTLALHLFPWQRVWKCAPCNSYSRAWRIMEWVRCDSWPILRRQQWQFIPHHIYPYSTV